MECFWNPFRVCFSYSSRDSLGAEIASEIPPFGNFSSKFFFNLFKDSFKTLTRIFIRNSSNDSVRDSLKDFCLQILPGVHFFQIFFREFLQRLIWSANSWLLRIDNCFAKNQLANVTFTEISVCWARKAKPTNIFKCEFLLKSPSVIPSGIGLFS